MIDVGDVVNMKEMKEQYGKLILGPLYKIDGASLSLCNTIVVVDALDGYESEENIKAIINLFLQMKNSTRLRLFVTS